MFKFGEVAHACFTFQDIGPGLAIIPLLGMMEATAIGKAFGMFVIIVVEDRDFKMK